MPDKLLNQNGDISDIVSDRFNSALKLAGDSLNEADTKQLLQSLDETTEIIIEFPSSADGRGFSIAATLSEQRGTGFKLFASGELNPDQLSLAFQCGFDGIIIDEAQWNRYGEESWTQAMDPVINRSYLRSHWHRLDPIWERRYQPSVTP